MLKFEFDKNEGMVFEASGTGLEISADVILMIRTVYDSLQEDNAKSAKIFRTIIKRAINDDLPFIDPDELHDKAKEVKEHIAKEELADLVKGVLEEILCS